MKMRSYSDKNSMSETDIGSADSPFSWLYHYNPTSKPGLSSLHRRDEPGLVVTPIRTICPTTESGNKNDWETKITQVRKHKYSVKGSNQIASKVLGPKQPMKKPSFPKKVKGPNIPEAKREKNNLNVDLNRTKFDFSGVPSPICSCTGVARSHQARARVAGRKMSNGAYFKLLLRLAAEGYDLSHPVDLKDHWARNGTNKFVTIK
ncbi:Inner membrane protein yohK isoform 1 [Hibiscus syriacus]|uniref:GAGA-binding transcriptional activator n=1 Tax=Hibiscus syriacus TaxID=106335 RepID=A0A6A3BGV6_HIBSY|nr:Inner membrane protein yohK isoform 1 [Hibiscus syriacus]